MFKVNNKGTSCSSLSIVNFEKVNADRLSGLRRDN